MDEITRRICRPDYVQIVDREERAAVTRLFRTLIQEGCVFLDFDDFHREIAGAGIPTVGIAPPRLKDLWWISLNPEHNICESYIDGKWHCTTGTLADVVLLLDSQRSGFVGKIRKAMDLTFLFVHFYKQHLMVRTSTRKVQSHYNFSNNLFEKILGHDMIYSCAVFNGSGETLDDAQRNKFKLIFDRASIASDTQGRALEIGCGWGRFALHLAENTNMTVHGISIAGSQIEYAKNNFSCPRLSNKLTYETRDYVGMDIEFPEYFDRVISIGMLEHVGKTEYKLFFDVVNGCLNRGGIALIHSIVKHHNSTTNSWIDKYIFPGGYVPQVSEILTASEQAGLLSKGVFIIEGRNYVETLRCWSRNLAANIEESIECIRNSNSDGLSDFDLRKAARIWQFYLESAQVMFLRKFGKHDVAHFVFVKP